jgi:hydroxymethylpyrimidine pyrophosphatase-like HAD family hydrolase
VYKLIACDIDGTILRSDGSASARTISAMRLAEKCGAKVSIATGRRVLSAAPVVAQFAIIEPYVAHCGAVVLDPGNDGVLMAREIPRQTALDVCHLAKARGVDAIVFESVNKGRALYVTPWKPVGEARPTWPRMRPECREVATYAEACSSDPVQLCIQGNSTAVGELLDELDTAFSNQVSFFDYGILEDGLRVADLFAPGVHKWTGVSFLADMWHIKPSEVIAFGDSMNDALMLEYAGLGVAMGNSPDELKDLADLVAPANDEDGVAMVIESLARGGLLSQ